MQEHTRWESFFDVTNLDWELWTQIFAVDLDDTWIGLVVAPDGELICQEMELSTSLEMVTLILLDRHYRNFQEIGATWDVSLEIHENWLLGLKMFFNLGNGNHDLLIIPSHIEWSDHSMICLSYCKWGSMWEY